MVQSEGVRMSEIVKVEGFDYDAAAIAQRLAEDGWNVRRSSGERTVARRGAAFLIDLIAKDSTPAHIGIIHTDGGVFIVATFSAIYVPQSVGLALWLRIEKSFPGATFLDAGVKNLPLSVYRLVAAQRLAVSLAMFPACALAALLVAVAIKRFLLIPLILSDDTMAPSMPSQTRVLVYRGPFLHRLVEPGVVVVCRGRGVGRVVAEGPAQVSIENGHVIVNDEIQDEPFARGGGGGSSEYAIARGEVLVVSDSRQQSRVTAERANRIWGVVFATYDLHGFRMLSAGE